MPQHMCRGYKTPENSLFPSFTEFWGPNSVLKASVVDTFDPLSHLTWPALLYRTGSHCAIQAGSELMVSSYLLLLKVGVTPEPQYPKLIMYFEGVNVWYLNYLSGLKSGFTGEGLCCSR